ncbi:acyl-CoA dehydrogenase family protein [Heyndrickxia acidicola]|uniref:Acyl-CoA dehydrogenase family protein n=1 Tax=Heyndrickxia acidicola TaxID=209389 RepID=A0ABU6MH99_9BACI|nr:acyl-CoA dehydrogenase family protein [Heyndrickxia acidicola]MED1204055.1 acyl-CoA dehydrogenase family protein [Heyndrickxia acidicola]
MEKTKNKCKGNSFLYAPLVMDNLFTPEDFNEEHKMIVKTAGQFAEKEVSPFIEEIENQNFKKVVELLKKAGTLGLLGHSVPENYGGLGLDKISKGIVGEAVGATGGYGVAHSNHTCIATLPITYFGTDEQKKKYLPKLASGDYIGAYCLTEPEAGSDALSARTTAVLNKKGTHYLLNGTKIYITNAEFSDIFIVYAKVDGKQFTAFIVEKNFPGLSLGTEEKKMGIKGSSTRSVIFEDCEVPVENVLGEIGKGHVIALNVLNLGRFNLGSACLGGAKKAFEQTLNFVKVRKQFKKSISDFGATKEKLASMASALYAAESLQYRTASLLEGALGDLYQSNDYRLIGQSLSEFAAECAVCKVFSSEMLDFTVDEALQLHGGAGFIKEYKIERMYRDARINRIFEGTNEINRLLIPLSLFKKAAKGMIPLEEYIQDAILELKMKRTADGAEEMAREQAAVASIRRIFLYCAGILYQRFGADLSEEQEALMALSNIGIQLYAAESSVYRSLKAIEKNGLEKEQVKYDLSASIVDEALRKVEGYARKLISGAVSGKEVLPMIQLIITELSSLSASGTTLRNRRIADAFLLTERYLV